MKKFNIVEFRHFCHVHFLDIKILYFIYSKSQFAMIFVVFYRIHENSFVIHFDEYENFIAKNNQTKFKIIFRNDWKIGKLRNIFMQTFQLIQQNDVVVYFNLRRFWCCIQQRYYAKKSKQKKNYNCSYRRSKKLWTHVMLKCANNRETNKFLNQVTNLKQFEIWISFFQSYFNFESLSSCKMSLIHARKRK